MRIRSSSARMLLHMTDELEENPFAGIEDDDALDDHGRRNALLTAAKRGYVPLRKTFVQRPRNSEAVEARPSARASVLFDLVNSRNQRALDLLLLIHAFQPILSGSPLLLATWAQVMPSKKPLNANAITRTLATLEEHGLVIREDDSRAPVLTLLREDGSRAEWTKPGTEDEEGPGYFTLPHAYWTDGLADTLKLPGKAMLLVMLHDTQNPKTPAFSMAVERAQEWYGLSERTAERGYRELDAAGLLQIKIQHIADPRHPTGRRPKYWRALNAPFSTTSRVRLQKTATKAARKAGNTSTADLVGILPAQPATQDQEA